jgi:hypothetical protein
MTLHGSVISSNNRSTLRVHVAVIQAKKRGARLLSVHDMWRQPAPQALHAPLAAWNRSGPFIAFEVLEPTVEIVPATPAATSRCY